MNTNRFEATVVNGQIQLPAGMELPDSTRLVVTVSPPLNLAVPRIASPRLADASQAADFVMEMGVMEMGESSDAGV